MDKPDDVDEMIYAFAEDLLHGFAERTAADVLKLAEAIEKALDEVTRDIIERKSAG